MYRLVQECVEEFVARHEICDVRTDRFVCLDVTNRRIDGYCYLFFESRGEGPALVAKLASTTKGKAIFRDEYGNLETLERIGMNASRPTTPQPLGLFERGDALVTLQAGLSGTSMSSIPGSRLFSRGNIATSLGQVIAWWCDFQDRFGIRRTRLDEEVYERTVLSEVRKFRRRFLTSRDEELFLARRFEQEHPLLGLELPFMARHGDFCTSNMILGDEGVCVFDWEFTLDHQPPLFDLFFFLSSARFPYAGFGAESTHFESFVSVFWKENYFRDEVRRRLGELCRRFDIPHESVADLLLLSVIQVGNMKYQALVDSHGIEEDTDDGVSDEDKRACWSRFELQSKNMPFASIRDGALENLRHIVRHGLPDLVGDARSRRA